MTAESKVSRCKARKCRAFLQEMPASYQDNGKIPSAAVARSSCCQLPDEGAEYISGISDDSPKTEKNDEWAAEAKRQLSLEQLWVSEFHSLPFERSN